MPDFSHANDPNAGLVKVRVDLVGTARESGYESETLWAEHLDANRYLIWNVPVLVYNLDMRDVVECVADPNGGCPIVKRVISRGDYRCVRLYFDPVATDEEIQGVLDLLGERRALVEKASRNLWAVGLRTEDDYEWVGTALKPLRQAGIVHIESSYQANQPEIGGVA